MTDSDISDLNTTLLNNLAAILRVVRTPLIRAANSKRQGFTTRVNGLALWMGVMKDKQTFVQEAETHKNVRLVVNYSLRKIYIYFEYNGQEYKAEIQNRDLVGRQILADELDRVLFFTFHLNHPPEYWRLTQRGFRVQDNKWARVTHIPATFDNTSPTGPVPIQDEGYLKLGQWIVLRMAFSKEREPVLKSYREVIDRGKEHHLVKSLSSYQRIHNTLPSSMLPGDIHEDLTDEEAVFIKQYALQGQLTRYQVNEHQLDASFYQEYAKLQPLQADDALRYLLVKMARDKCKLPGTLLKEIASTQTGLGQRKKKKTKRLISVKKVLVTPTTLRIEPPQVETTNRVLRQFRPHLDRFLRIQFIDERGTQVHTSSNMCQDNSAVNDRLARVLTQGIRIGSLHYTFLAFSSSQLREHGCWFFANTSTVTVDDIRRWMGNFSRERVVAKYAARMGQCFSSTQAITKLKKKQVKQIPDIERNGYTFSDGVGLISPELAKVVAHAHRHRQAQTSAAFQFRLGGAKGVLTVAKHRTRSFSCAQVESSFNLPTACWKLTEPRMPRLFT